MTHYAIIPLVDNYIIGSLTYRLAQHNRQEFPLLFSDIEKYVTNYGHGFESEMHNPSTMYVYQYNRLLCKIIAI